MPDAPRRLEPDPGSEIGAGAPRIATLYVSDLQGSTALTERLDAETWRTVLGVYFSAMRTEIERNDGTIAKIIGDAVVAVFRDDGDAPAGSGARRAVAAAAACTRALTRVNDQLSAKYSVTLVNRTGIATGVLTGGADDTASEVLSGEVLTRAEALESGAPPMAVLLDAATVTAAGDGAAADAPVVRPVGPVVPKRGGDPVEAFQLVVADAPSVEDTVTEEDGDSDVPGDREDRRTVTVLFADPRLTGADGSALATDVAHATASWFAEVALPIVERHGGTAERFVGDALMAVFGLPTRREDDAARALRAADELRTSVATAVDVLSGQWAATASLRLGVATGAVVAGDAATGERMVTGDAVNVAARFMQAAAPGAIVCGELTVRLAGDVAEVRELPSLTLRGKTAPVAAFELVGVRRSEAAAGRRHHLPLIGRTAELGALTTELARAAERRHAVRITLLGDAGVGKSRLVLELVDRAGGAAHVLRGGCLSYGQGITFWPLLRVVHHAAGVDERDGAAEARAKIAALAPDAPDVVERLQSLAGLHEVPFAIGEQIWALRRMLERMAHDHPLVLVVDDVHWAEPALLDAIDELTATTAAPVLVLCTARRSMLDDRREFVEAAPHVTLGPFDRAAGEEFLRLLVGASDGASDDAVVGGPVDVDARAIERILDASGGNPLFLEQLLSMLVDDGRLRRVDDRWRLAADLGEVEVPPTIEAVLTARLDLLPPGQRGVIEPASVIGNRFATSALTHLVAPPEVPALDQHLRGLAARELVTPPSDDGDVHRFQHQLVRDATYQGMLKQVRARLHERFVAWGDATNQARDRAAEFEAIQGHHLEQAYRYRVELGQLDERTAAIGLDASGRLRSAGERSLAQGDVAAAGNLLQRAVRLLPDGHHDVPAVLLLAGRALHECGDFDAAIDAYERAAIVAHASGDEPTAIAGGLEALRLQYLTGRVDDAVMVEREADAAIAHVDPAAHPGPASRAWQLRLNVEIAACRWAAAQAAASEVITLAARAGDTQLEVRTMPLLAFLAQKGPMPVDAATEACEAVLTRVAFDRRSSAMTQLELAMLAAMQLDAGDARARCIATRQVLDELGWQMQAALVSLASGPIELLLDDPVRAEAELRSDLDALQRLDERNFISLTTVLLAEAVYRQRRFDEASALHAAATELVAPDDVAVEILLGTVGAKLAARRGDHPLAGALVHAALDAIDRTDDPSGQGDALLDAAEVRWLGGDHRGARAAAVDAAERYAAKGNLAGARRAAATLARLRAGADPLGADPLDADPLGDESST